MSASAQITPWQKMRANEVQYRKLERKRKPVEIEDPSVVYAEPIRPCNPFLTYYNNGKVNQCKKDLYDYHFFYCEGYDQARHREDFKHTHIYMNIDLEEEYPCRTVPILTNSNYGHRPPLDNMGRVPKLNLTKDFNRNNGAAYCVGTNANGYVYNTVSYNPTKPFYWNAQFGYTYAPPKNN